MNGLRPDTVVEIFDRALETCDVRLFQFVDVSSTLFASISYQLFHRLKDEDQLYSFHIPQLRFVEEILMCLLQLLEKAKKETPNNPNIHQLRKSRSSMLKWTWEQLHLLGQYTPLKKDIEFQRHNRV